MDQSRSNFNKPIGEYIERTTLEAIRKDPSSPGLPSSKHQMQEQILLVPPKSEGSDLDASVNLESNAPGPQVTQTKGFQISKCPRYQNFQVHSYSRLLCI